MIKEQATIKITTNTQPKINQIDWDNIPFGKVFTDHMLVMDYHDGKWQTPEIMPFGPIPMHPAMSAIHYGQAIFEGMKAFRRDNDDVVLFRPEMNAKRFAESCERLCIPPIDEALFVELINRLVDIDREWVPRKEGYSLYIRPVIFATDEAIGVKPSESYKFIVFLCPVGAYYSQAVSVKVEEYYTRAAIGGVGRAKAAGNYASALYPALLSQKEGYNQLLWTDAKEHKYFEESGTMNICFVVDGKLLTPSEDEDTILRGTTKRTIVDVAEKWGFPVEERKITVEEIIKAAEEGRLQEAFGAGTAATIASIAKINFRGKDFNLPAITSDFFSQKVKNYLDDLKKGKLEDTDNWCKII
ncbi:MAG: branched-chain amino acid aminotransferase [Crocinitomicaceae bacterium]|nr:branched-chain amino acid aminotransferase [Crocinitomicaceae bacterium]